MALQQRGLLGAAVNSSDLTMVDFNDGTYQVSFTGYNTGNWTARFFFVQRSATATELGGWAWLPHMDSYRVVVPGPLGGGFLPAAWAGRGGSPRRPQRPAAECGDSEPRPVRQRAAQRRRPVHGCACGGVAGQLRCEHPPHLVHRRFNSSDNGNGSYTLKFLPSYSGSYRLALFLNTIWWRWLRYCCPWVAVALFLLPPPVDSSSVATYYLFIYLFILGYDLFILDGWLWWRHCCCCCCCSCCNCCSCCIVLLIHIYPLFSPTLQSCCRLPCGVSAEKLSGLSWPMTSLTL